MNNQAEEYLFKTLKTIEEHLDNIVTSLFEIQAEIIRGKILYDDKEIILKQ